MYLKYTVRIPATKHWAWECKQEPVHARVGCEHIVAGVAGAVASDGIGGSRSAEHNVRECRQAEREHKFGDLREEGESKPGDEKRVEQFEAAAAHSVARSSADRRRATKQWNCSAKCPDKSKSYAQCDTSTTGETRRQSNLTIL